MTVPRSLDSLSSRRAAPVTCTVSPTPPTESARSTRCRAFTATVKFSAMAVVKPWSSAFSEYVPTRTLRNWYWPRSSLTAVVEIPVAGLVSVTVTPGMAAPVWSLMKPRTVALSNWAKAAAAQKCRAQSTVRRRAKDTLTHRGPFQESGQSARATGPGLVPGESRICLMAGRIREAF